VRLLKDEVVQNVIESTYAEVVTEVKEELRKTGIDVIGDTPWGAHFCQFYETKEDLIDVLVPYFKAGLENNEFCMWITSEPLCEEEAKEAIRKAMPDFHRYLKKGQIEIVPYTEWYLKDGAFNLKRVLNAWVDKLNQALAKGYDGIRVTGNTAWLEKRDWRDFTDYEEEVNNVIGKYRMIAICTYSLDKCGASEVIDVVRNHQFALIRRRGEWELIESSERKRVKEALRGSEAKFRNIFESANDCMALLDRSGRILDANQKAVEVFGGSKEELLGKHFMRVGVVSFEDIPRVMSAFAKVLAGKQATINIHVKNKKDQEIHLECSASLMRIDDKFAGILLIARDITERKQAEKALQESEERYRELTESISDVFFAMDKDLRYTYWNKASDKLTGILAKDAIGKSLTEVFPNVKGTRVEQFYQEVLKTKQSQIFVNEFRLGDKDFVFEINAYPTKDGLSVFVKDITERKQMEEKLRESEEKWRSLVKNAPNVILIVNRDGKIQFINRTVIDASPEEVIGKSVYDFVDSRHHDVVRKTIRRVFQTGEGSSYEISGTGPDGGTSWYATQVGPIKRDGQIVSVTLITVDITERKEAEEELRFLKEFNERIVNSLDDALLVIDPNDYTIISANEATLKKLKLRKEDLIGKTCYEATHHSSAPCKLPHHICPIQETLRTGKAVTVEHTHFDKDNKKIFVEVSAQPVRNQEGKIVHFVHLARDITERKKAEDALRKSESKARTLIENLPQKIFFKDKNSVYISCNENYARDLKIHPDEISGKTDYDFYPKSLAEKYRADDQRIMKSRKAEDIEEEYIQDGHKVFVHTVKTPVKDENGNVVGILGIFWDITERKVAEDALRESEEKFRSLAEQSPNMIFINKKGRVIYANRKCEELMGYKKEEFYSPDFNFLTLFSPESIDLVKSNFSRHMQGEEVAPYEFTLITKEGKKIETILTATLMRYEGERAILGILTDITDRKQMEEKLRHYSEHLEELVQKRTEEFLESEKRYSVLVEEARDGVVILQDAKLVFTNKRLAEIIGYSRYELIGMPFEKLVGEKYLQQAKERYTRRMRGEKVPATYEVELVTKTGECIPVEVSATRINYQGRPSDLVIVRDIRERKRIEEEHLKLEKLATIGELATMVGHDLRNPLQSIENAAYYLNNELPHLPISPRTMEMLQVINDSINYADKIIRDLQDYSATKKPILEKTDINAIITETLSQVKAPENVKLITELSQLPETNADKDMIKRVFMNLATNGIQAMESEGTLKVSTKKTHEFVEVSFKDTGIGMPKENMEKIFTPFFTTKAKGMGMGLPICKRFVESHGGTIQVESEVGKGSTFTVKLPIQQPNGGEKLDEG